MFTNLDWMSFGFGMIFSATVIGAVAAYTLVREDRRTAGSTEAKPTGARLQADAVALHESTHNNYKMDFALPDLRGRTVPKGKT